MFQNIIKVPTAFEEALVQMAEREECEATAVSELTRLWEVFQRSASAARRQASQADNQIGHGVHTGEAGAFEAAAADVSLALERIGNQQRKEVIPV